MTVHVPQYEALPPEELPTRITQLLKEQETRKRHLIDENTTLRVQLEQAEQQAVDMAEHLHENELLLYQTLHLVET
ncbi:hypothetical protein PF010_g28443 [Phytophthora fragariae]|uniref:Uncharacterized protein n=1 Tax=Phytophthora fragariae TaxID=53985 RepID=A0A6G0JR31_9STRA|nr:hypothetical protein PF010_g28443 [Phytophthora fragariae]